MRSSAGAARALLQLLRNGTAYTQEMVVALLSCGDLIPIAYMLAVRSASVVIVARPSIFFQTNDFVARFIDSKETDI